MAKKLGILFLISFVLINSTAGLVCASENNSGEIPSVETIIEKIKENQSKIIDMSANVETTIASTLKDSKPILQTGRILTKSPDKSKIEVYSPMKQITITNGDMMTVISPDTGMKFTQDLSKAREKGNMPQISAPGDASKVFDYFDLKLTAHGTEEYIISGTPKEENEFLGKIDFFIGSARFLPMRIVIYNPDGILISISEIKYKEISDIWVPEKTTSIVSIPGGSMNVDMQFKNIQVNKGISDDEFKID